MGSDHQRFIVPPAEPAYLDPRVRAMLPERARAAAERLSECRICPRACGTARMQDEDTGICQTGRRARVASAFPHFGEESCLRGSRGSGTIFFAMCSLRCVFCQNWDISQQTGAGVEQSADRLAELMIDLQEQGCHNINFVTPTHVLPQIVEAVARAVERGLCVPIVYNTSAYDTVESLRLLDGIVDIYMPDFKFWSSQTARQLANAADYPERAREAIREMHRQVGDLCLTPAGVAQRGLLVRHLVMPNQVDQSRHVFEWLARQLSPDTFVNIMGQYRPEHRVGGRGTEPGPDRFSEINRRLSVEELSAAYTAARAAGLWRFDQRPPLMW